MAARGQGGRSRSAKARREFVSEVEEILERMRDDLARLAEQADAGRGSDPEIVNGLFRSAHSLKGLSGMFGLDGMSELAHHLEDVLDGLRMGRAVLDAPGIALFDESVTLVSSTLSKLDDETGREGLEETLGALVARIDAWTRSGAAEEPEAAELDLDPAMLRTLTEYEEHRLGECTRSGKGIYVVEADFEILSFEEGLAELGAAIKELGELISTLPSPGESEASQIRFSMLVASELAVPDLCEQLGVSPERVHQARAVGAPEAERAPAAPVPEAPAEEAAVETSLKSISETVRVDIRKLDELMNLVGELVTQRGAVKAIAAELAQDARTSRHGLALAKVHKTLERKLQELQAGVLDVRMVPLRQVFDKLVRVTRRLRLDLGKEVALEIRGADTELDKLIVEELVDPLMHVVRNAYDHAIESPEERAAAGKPREGRVRVEAFQRGNDVVIQLADDGRGIDADAVRARAVAQGLLGVDEEISDREALDLIFAPGLSTRAEVTETSGRGVGMDVVRSNIAALGGIVDVESHPGRGTTLSMTLPITLAIIQALIVGVGEQSYAIPLNSVRETLLLDPADVQRSDGREMLNLRGEALLLRRLADEFGLEGAAGSDKGYAVVLGLGDMRLGLVVDDLRGQQDTVIKPIQGPASKVRGIAGATELGELGAVLVLDVSALVEDAVRGREAASERTADGGESTSAAPSDADSEREGDE